MVYLWIEDKSSGKFFWERVCKILFDNQVIVESKGSAGNLVKSVEKLVKAGVDDSTYYILFDNVFDNPMNSSYLTRLKACSRCNSNIVWIAEYVSLEASLLSYFYLLDYLNKQKSLSSLNEEIKARSCLLKAIDSSDNSYSVAKEILDYCVKYSTKKKYTVESLASSLLKNLTRDTGFKVDKSIIGDCWLQDCCSSKRVYSSCIESTPSVDKVNKLVNNSFLKDIMNRMVV